MKKLWSRMLIKTAIHLCAWALVVFSPFIFLSAFQHEMPDGMEYIRFSFFPFMLMIIFYVNYFFLVDKFLLKKKLFSFICVNLLLVAFLILCTHLWHEFFYKILDLAEPISKKKGRGPSPFIFISRNAMVMLLTAGLSIAIRMTEQWYYLQIVLKNFEKEKIEVKLKELKSQLHPHFLFNTLNNIYALIAIDQEKAQNAVHDLSGLLRYVLKENKVDLVSLSDEIIFMENYIALMNLRLSENVTVSIDFPKLTDKKYILPPLLFISLIENAFKHGVSVSKKSEIRIKLNVSEEGLLEFRCTNIIFEKEKLSKDDSGIGLQNLRNRLEYLYPEAYIFDTFAKEGCFLTYLSFNIHDKAQ